MKRNILNVFFLIILLLSLFMHGCIPAMATGVGLAAGAAGGVMGSSMYHASKDDKDKEKMGASQDVPNFLYYKASNKRCMDAVVQVLSECGDTIEIATETLIKTGKTRQTEELGMVSSIMGRSEVSTVKTITLSNEKGATKVNLKVDVYRKTMYTDEAKKEWEEYAAKVRKDFFDRLSKKIKPAS